MSDSVDWARETFPGHRELLSRTRDLVDLRTKHPALHRNEIAFFGFSGGSEPGFHPAFDGNDGERLFAYCRTAGQPLGSAGQVMAVCNCADRNYPEVWLDWP